MTDLIKIALTVEVLVPAFDPREVLIPGEAHRDPGGEWDASAPYTALDRFAECVHDGLAGALENWTANGDEECWIEPGSLRARVVETVPALPATAPGAF